MIRAPLTKLYVEITTTCNLDCETYIDRTGNGFPTCGACFWAQGFIQCL